MTAHSPHAVVANDTCAVGGLKGQINSGQCPQSTILQASSEVITAQNGAKTGNGIIGVRDLLGAPYHMLAMIRGYRDIGVAVRDKFDVGLSPNNRFALNMDFGYKNADGPQVPAAGTVFTYPCDGSTGINHSLRGENPNPVPGRNLGTNPLGTSIGISVEFGKTLVITSGSMIKVSAGATVVLRPPVMAANDPNAIGGVSYFKTNEGFISADSPLDASTQYQVTITGTSSGTPFSRTFVFTTGA